MKIKAFIVVAAVLLAGTLTASAQTATFDALGRVTRVGYGGTTNVAYGYDAAGNITNIMYSGQLSEPDTDADGMPDMWEWVWFNTLTNTAAGDWNQDTRSNLQHYQDGTDPTDPDSDGDGMINTAERLAGTDPLNAASFLGLVNVWRVTLGMALQWQSVTGKTYRLTRSTNLPQHVWTPIRTNIPGIAPMNTATDTTAVGTGPWSYRIELE